MSERQDHGHLDLERISALLDEPRADLAADEHLQGCPRCRGEFERLRRMRMAFSAMGDLEPPAGAWEAIEARLDELVGTSSDPVPLRRPGLAARLARSTPLRAAAAVALFAGGVLAGVEWAGKPAAEGPAGQPAVAALPSVVSPDDREVLDALTQLESLRTPLRQAGLDDAGPVSGGGEADRGMDPVQAARLAARLDGLIKAMQDRLERTPDDPVASAYLLEFLDERARLAEAIERWERRSGVVEW